MARREELSVELDNVTESLGTLTVAGPRARQLMARLCDQDTSGSYNNYISTIYRHIYCVSADTMDSWKFLDARKVEVGGVPCLAVRISYTGELGWELYPAMADMKQLYRSVLALCRYLYYINTTLCSAIMGAGADLGIGHAGTRVINTLRIEKGEEEASVL